jgi:hypothetical protein
MQCCGSGSGQISLPDPDSILLIPFKRFHDHFVENYIKKSSKSHVA